MLVEFEIGQRIVMTEVVYLTTGRGSFADFLQRQSRKHGGNLSNAKTISGTSVTLVKGLSATLRNLEVQISASSFADFEPEAGLEFQGPTIAN